MRATKVASLSARLVLIAATTLLLPTCSRNLSRSKAEQLIRSVSKFPQPVKVEVAVGDLDDCSPVWRTDGRHSNDRFIALGMLKVQRSGPPGPGVLCMGGPAYPFRIDPTPAGQQYVLGNDTGMPAFLAFRMWETDFGEVTGIQSDAQNAIANYTTRGVNPTPFASNFDPNQKEDHTAVFVKFDDGWRIAQIDGMNVRQ